MSSSSSSVCKVVMFNSSPHKGGNTDHMVQWVSDELTREGIVVEVVRVGGPGISLSGCSGCGGCANRNRCVKNDPINDYYQKMLEADGIVLAWARRSAPCGGPGA
eukprot:m51a1_g13057 hypothetical protein (105) ;mRNA; r:21-532